MKSPGTVKPALIETVDIYPTLAELCDLRIENLYGDSFSSILENPNSLGPDAANSYHRPWHYLDNPYPSGP